MDRVTPADHGGSLPFGQFILRVHGRSGPRTVRLARASAARPLAGAGTGGKDALREGREHALRRSGASLPHAII